MKENRKNSAIFVEALFIVVFLLFAVVILVELFSSAQRMSNEARYEQEASLFAQDTCEAFAAVGDDGTFVSMIGAVSGIDDLRYDGARTVFVRDGYSVDVTEHNELREGGTLRRADVTVSREGMSPVTYVASRYVSNDERSVG